ncbi:nitrite/sulfite reductase [Salsipaludibacter albus]|uniref:nitrite/sulfite reductase n=1 Tax=Salsipaludibacter albus TaxID=2849650 RepID=UPI001EE3F977|nr:nitrite/sulfite reductase [Salsipaludibacter albus]MBY5161835.1 nitrite/sulfite reductase [Salsipaludibacter albus]
MTATATSPDATDTTEAAVGLLPATSTHPDADVDVDAVADRLFPRDLDVATLTPDDLPSDGWGDLDEIDELDRAIADVAAGRLSEDEFKPRRLHFGMYGIRQSTDTHMVRIKVPLGRFDARQFAAMAVLVERHAPPGVAHITTRQCIQVHRVHRSEVTDVLRLVAAAGLTTREACGNSVRNVTMSPLAGVHPDEVIDLQAVATETIRHLLRHPSYQALPRKFKIAFAATTTDDVATGIHDIGVRPTLADDGTPGYRIVLGGGLGSAPHEAVELEEFTPADQLLPTAVAVLDLFDLLGEREKRVRARMKFLVKKLGREEFLARVKARREEVLATGLRSTVTLHPHVDEADAASAPRALPDHLNTAGDAAARYRQWVATNVTRQRDGRAFAVFASAPLGDLTVPQLRALAAMMETHDLDDARLTIRQNVVFRDVPADALPNVWAILAHHGLDEPFAEKAGDVVSCPGAETCNLAITASRGLGGAITDRLATDRLDTVDGVQINISGCPNSCGQHQAWDLGFSGMAKRDSEGNEAPAYRIWLGGHVEDGSAKFGKYVTNVPARNAPVAASRIIADYKANRQDDEALWQYVDRIGGKQIVADLVTDLKDLPDKADDPTFYTDLGKDDGFAVILGESECA